MKHFFYLLLAVTFLASCGDKKDKEDDEVFITDETVAHETLKNTWIVQEIVYKTNFSAFDKAMNDASKLTLKQNTLSLQFQYRTDLGANYVTSETNSKNGGLGLGELNLYTVNKDQISVKESDNTYSLYTFRISERKLIMETTITKDKLRKELEREGTNSAEVDAFINALPDNLSGTETTYLRKK